MNSEKLTTSEVNYKISGPPLDLNKDLNTLLSIHSTLGETHPGNVHRSSFGRLYLPAHPPIQAATLAIELVVFRIKRSLQKN